MITTSMMAGMVVGWVYGQADDLEQALSKATEMTNYSCKIASRMEGGGGRGGRGDMVATELRIQADAPWHLKRRETEAYKKGEAFVAKDKDGHWKKVERPQRRQGDRRGRGDRGQMELLMLRNLRAPHEVLKGLGSKLKDVKREDSDGGACFTGRLTPEAAREFGGMGQGRRGGGGDEPDLEYSGSVKIWITDGGAVARYEIETETKGEVRGRDINLKRTQKVEISDVGRTEFSVPEEARKALGE
ncbi:MAG: hypothetical protein HY716_13375 [Planctomycetes bacterium]|nr:hypothetical protein [Planctomycetota bacterium]